MIRCLSDRGVVKSEKTVVSSLISREDAREARLDDMVDETFEGSRPSFIAAFSKSKRNHPAGSGTAECLDLRL